MQQAYMNKSRFHKQYTVKKYTVTMKDIEVSLPFISFMLSR